MLTGREILQTGAFIRKTQRYAEKLPANLSVLILQGSDDQIVKCSTVEEVMQLIPSTDKRMVVIPDCGHLLLGTAYLKPSVVTPLKEWLIHQTDYKQTAHSDSARKI